MLDFLLKNVYLIQDSEDKDTVYLCKKNKRYVFRHGKYYGWYRP